MIENILVITIISITAFFPINKLYKRLQPSKISKCSSGCNGCDLMKEVNKRKCH